MRFDIIIEPNRTPEETARLGRLAEECGLGGVWVANNSNGRDAFVNFAPLAMQTSKIHLGPIAVSPQELHPLKMAVSLLSFNELSGGRGQIVVGAGGGTAAAMHKTLERPVAGVRECIQILERAARGEAFSHQGEHFPIRWIDTRWVSQEPPMIYAGANGPQMLRSAARHARGIMVSDFTPDRVRWARDLINPVLADRGVDAASYPLNNFWAWHVKESPEAARREARIWLYVRATAHENYVRDVLDEDEAQLVIAQRDAFRDAWYRKSPDIEGVPDSILDKLVDGAVSASPLADIDREVERMRAFADAGLNQIALRLYDDAEASIRIIGDKLVGAI